MMTLRLATPGQSIDPGRIQKLEDLSRNGRYVTGAMITSCELEAFEGIAISLRIPDAGREAC